MLNNWQTRLTEREQRLIRLAIAAVWVDRENVFRRIDVEEFSDDDVFRLFNKVWDKNYSIELKHKPPEYLM